MATRSCIACRNRCEQATLIPLGLDPVGSLSIGQRSQRSAWVCPSPACIQQVCAQPRLLARAFRSAPPDTQDLAEKVRIHLHEQMLAALRTSHRSGLVQSGAKAIQSAPPDHFIALVCAADASNQSKQSAMAHQNPISTFVINLDRQELGRWLGCGPRSVLGLRPGRPSKCVTEYLRRWEMLG